MVWWGSREFAHRSIHDLSMFMLKIRMFHKSNARTQPQETIAYILGTFPNLTTTFIDREILEAKRQGVNLVLVAIRRHAPFDMRAEAKRLAEETRYLLPVPWLKFLMGNLYFVLARPWIYFSTFAYLLTRRHDTVAARIKTPLHFAEGVWAAALLRQEHIGHIHAHFADRAAVVALVAACQAFEALDDYPGQIDQTVPTGVEDEPPAAG